MRKPRLHRILIVPALLIAALLPEQAMACVSVSVDWWLDGDEVHATAFVEDYYDEGECFDSAFSQWGYWTHDYSASVNIESPTGRSVSDSDSWDDVPYGGGFANAFDFISVANEHGIYNITVNVAIDCSVAGSIGGGGSGGQVLVYDLECTPSVTRGGTATATLNAPGASNQNWSFSGGGGTASKTGDNSWSGTMVEGGQIRVTFTLGRSTGLAETCYIAVNNRTGWSATAAAAVDRTNPQNSLATNCGDLSVSTYTPLGAACLDPDINWFVVEVPGGPNDGFKYVDSVTDSTTYDYLILNELDTPGTAFYDAQCGNYDPSTGTGYISGARLRTNAHRHEGGTRASHWDQYRDTLSRSSVNWGRIPESLVGSPTTSLTQHNIRVRTAIESAIQTVLAAYRLQPCGSSDMGYNGSCVYQGPTNGGPPYAACQ